MLQLSQDPIAHMRAVVRTHPMITVRELAREMGYSEDRSVYYWLRKAGFKGLRDFKARVLAESRLESGVEKHEGFNEPNVEDYGYDTFIIETNEFSPWLLPGDRIVVDSTQRPQDGNLVLIDSWGGSGNLRRYIQGSPSLLIHPTNPRDIIRLDSEKAPTLRRVIRLIRELP